MDKTVKRNAIKDFVKKKSIVIVVIGTLLISNLIFMFFPIIYAFVGSFFDWNPMLGKFDFLGFHNYIEAFSSPLMWKSLGNSIYFTIVVVFFRTVLGLIFALMINSLPKFKGFFRTCYYLPVITSLVAVSLVWKIMYNPAFGIINQLLTAIGLPGPDWLVNATTALPAIMIMTIWKDTGYSVVLFIAGLQGIPNQYREAATIDGANRWQLCWHIILPLLKNTTFFIVVTSLISYMQTFTQILVLTEGGPGYETFTSVYLLYDEAFSKYRFGYASAISFLLFIVILALSVIQVRANLKSSQGD